MKVTEAEKELYATTVKMLKGSDRRLFMARTIKALGSGGKEWATNELGWSGITMRKGMLELETGIVCHIIWPRPMQKPVI